ncbi:hypothetical protein [Polaribacter sp. R77954]|uniref:hypothetical protein n=1 Tax=Polaribacter sp. R77954 TaxID=3093870 RepID=UPI0037C7A740
MKIIYKKKVIYANLMFGIVWDGLGIFKVLEGNNLSWSGYLYLVIGLLFIGNYLYCLKNQYLTIENGTIRKNVLYGFVKKVNLKEIKLIKKFASDYILKTETKQLKIHTEAIEEKSLSELNRILTELNVSPEKMPFGNKV